MAFIGKESAYRNRRKSRNPTQIPGIKRIPRSSARRAGDSDEFHGYGQSAVITLGAHGKQAFRGNTVGKTVFRTDKLLAFQFLEYLHSTIAEQPALAGIAFYIGHFAGIVADYYDSATLGEGMEGSLLKTGNVHGNTPYNG